MIDRKVGCVLAAILAAGCQTQTSSQPPRDSSGTIVQRSEPKDLRDAESHIKLHGPNAPEVLRRQVRMRDNSVRQEVVWLNNRSAVRGVRPRVYVESPPSYYNARVADLFLDREWVAEQANKEFDALEIIVKAREATNASGRFVYLVGADKNDLDDQCIFAMQLTNLASTSLPGPNYKDSLVFLYCAPDTTESSLLKAYDSVRVRKQ